MGTRTSASSVQPLLRNGEQFPQNLVGDGTCLMRAVHLMGSILPVDVLATAVVCILTTKVFFSCVNGPC